MIVLFSLTQFYTFVEDIVQEKGMACFMLLNRMKSSIPFIAISLNVIRNIMGRTNTHRHENSTKKIVWAN